MYSKTQGAKFTYLSVFTPDNDRQLERQSNKETFKLKKLILCCARWKSSMNNRDLRQLRRNAVDRCLLETGVS